MVEFHVQCLFLHLFLLEFEGEIEPQVFEVLVFGLEDGASFSDFFEQVALLDDDVVGLFEGSVLVVDDYFKSLNLALGLIF